MTEKPPVVKGPVCALTGVPLTSRTDPPHPLNPPMLVMDGQRVICGLAAESLTEIKVLKIVLRRDSRTGQFTLDQAACIEAWREPYQSYDDD